MMSLIAVAKIGVSIEMNENEIGKGLEIRFNGSIRNAMLSPESDQANPTLELFPMEEIKNGLVTSFPELIFRAISLFEVEIAQVVERGVFQVLMEIRGIAFKAKADLS